MIIIRSLRLIFPVVFLFACHGDGDTLTSNNFESFMVEAGENPKQLAFSWDFDGRADAFRLEMNPDGDSGFSPVDVNGDGTINGDDLIGGDATELHLTLSVFRTNFDDALYRLVALDKDGDELGGTDDLTIRDIPVEELIGYFKASENRRGAEFGKRVAMSGDGRTFAVAAESTLHDENPQPSAVYIFVSDADGVWSQQAMIEEPDTAVEFDFARSIALSSDGDTLAAGDRHAVYVFTRSGDRWEQQDRVVASNADPDDLFGFSGFGNNIALSDSGDTLVVGASQEDSGFQGISTDGTGESNNSNPNSGAVYVFERDSDHWEQQAYIKASNGRDKDNFGAAVSLSGDGNTLAVGAPSVHIVGMQNDDEGENTGAAYVFTRRDGEWEQQAYIKAPNADVNDLFGTIIALSRDGSTLAAGAPGDDSGATGINGDQGNSPNHLGSGAIHVFTRAGDTWEQQAYIKLPSRREFTMFGASGIALSADGNTLAAGDIDEGGLATGINNDPMNDGHEGDNAGAVYVFTRDSDGDWEQLAYVKASNTTGGDEFGASVALSSDGSTMAVGAMCESSGASGIDSDPGANGRSWFCSGATYLY